MAPSRARRTWRKLHPVVDAASGMIVAQTLTDQGADDPSQVAPLLDQIDGGIARVTAAVRMMAHPFEKKTERPEHLGLSIAEGKTLMAAVQLIKIAARCRAHR